MSQPKSLLKLQLESLEDRSLPTVAPGNPAFITQIYSDLLNRTPSAREVSSAAAVADRSANGAQVVVQGVLDSPEYLQNQVRSLYRTLLGREADAGALNSSLNFLRGNSQNQGARFRTLQLSLLNSNEYFQTSGNTNTGLVRNLFGDLLGRGVDPGAQPFIDQLNRGTPRTRVVSTILDSAEAKNRIVDSLFSNLLNRNADSAGLNGFSRLLQSGRSIPQVTRDIVLSAEYTSTNRNVTRNLVETLQAQPQYSTLLQALQTADLLRTLNGPGPFTLFAPTNAAFAALPAGALQNLLQPANRQQLIGLLTYHVIPGKFSGAELVGLGRSATVQGSQIGFSPLTGGVQINNSSVVSANLRAENGIVHGINSVLSIPTANIVEAAQAEPQLSTLVQAVQAAGLAATLSGPGPFTVFAPTNAAFAALPAGTLQNLLLPANRQQLVNLLNYHVVAGRFSAPELGTEGSLRTILGPEVRMNRADNRFAVNTSNLIVPNRIATNGVIHLIDRVLSVP